jgi:hypothetical protein
MVDFQSARPAVLLSGSPSTTESDGLPGRNAGKLGSFIALSAAVHVVL